MELAQKVFGEKTEIKENMNRFGIICHSQIKTEPKHPIINKTPRILGRKPDLKTK